MARIPGTFTRNYNNEVTIQAPIDARTLVGSYADLTAEENWIDKDGYSIAFNGLVVSVADLNDPSKNGIYYLFDPKANPDEWIDPDVKNAENWHKISDSAELTGQLKDYVSSESLAATLETYVKTDVLGTAIKENQAILDITAQVAANTGDIATLNENISGIQATLEGLGTPSTDEAGATGLYLKVEEIEALATENTAKLTGIDTTVLEVIEEKIEAALENIPAAEVKVATEDTIGGIKSTLEGANKVSVLEDGTASVNTVNISTLVQTDEDILILCGGDCGYSE